MVTGCTLLVPLAAHYLTARSIPSDFPFIKKFANFISLISRKLAMACKRGGSFFLLSISSSLIRNRNHNTRALSICNGKRTSHPNTASINKMEEAQGIPTEQANVLNENAQVLRIESIEKKLVELLGEFRAANDIRRHEIMYEFEKEAAKLEHEFRQAGDWIEKESANERSKADKAFSKLKKEFNQARARTNIAYYCALSVVIAILAKRWL